MEPWRGNCTAPAVEDRWFAVPPPGAACSLNGDAFAGVVAVLACAHLTVLILCAATLPVLKEDTARKHIFLCIPHSTLAVILLVGTLLFPAEFQASQIAPWVLWGPFITLHQLHIVFGVTLLRHWVWAITQVDKNFRISAGWDGFVLRASVSATCASGLVFSVVIPILVSKGQGPSLGWTVGICLFALAQFPVVIMATRYVALVLGFLESKALELTNKENEPTAARRALRIVSLKRKMQMVLVEAVANIFLVPAIWIALIFFPIAPLILLVDASTLGITSFSLLVYFERPRITFKIPTVAREAKHGKLEVMFRHLGASANPVIVPLPGVVISDAHSFGGRRNWSIRFQPSAGLLALCSGCFALLASVVFATLLPSIVGIVPLLASLGVASIVSLFSSKPTLGYLATMPAVQFRIGVALAVVAALAACAPSKLFVGISAFIMQICAVLGDSLILSVRRHRDGILLASTLTWIGLWIVAQVGLPNDDELAVHPSGGVVRDLCFVAGLLGVMDSGRRIQLRSGFFLIFVQIPLPYILESYGARSHRLSVASALSNGAINSGHVFLIEHGVLVSGRVRRALWFSGAGLIWLAAVVLAAAPEQSVAVVLLAAHGLVLLLASTSFSTEVLREAWRRAAPRLLAAAGLGLVCGWSLPSVPSIIVSTSYYLMLAGALLTEHADATYNGGKYGARVELLGAFSLIFFTTFPVLLATNAIADSALQVIVFGSGLNRVRVAHWVGVVSACYGASLGLGLRKSLECRRRCLLWGLRLDAFAQYHARDRTSEGWGVVDGVDIVVRNSAGDVQDSAQIETVGTAPGGARPRMMRLPVMRPGSVVDSMGTVGLRRQQTASVEAAAMETVNPQVLW